MVDRVLQIHLLQLSDGRPHPLATVDPTVFRLDSGQGTEITKLSILISKRRLVVAVSVNKNSALLIWDWRNGHRLFVSAPNPLLPARGLLN